MLNNGCNDFLFGVHCVEEGDRIPPLQSYGQGLKQKDCFSGVLGDDCGASANLLDYPRHPMCLLLLSQWRRTCVCLPA